MSDVRITQTEATATVEGNTDAGEAFVDSWIHGVLSVADVGCITVSAEVLGDLRKEATEVGLTVETS